MGEKWGWRKWGFMVFFGIMLLHITAILLFTRGFLLTRTELSQYSQCSDVSESPCLSPEYQNPELNEEEDDSDDEHCCRHHHRNQNQTVNPDIQAQSCWTKPAVDRIVIIILDALRFDFVAPSSFFEERKPWMDKLPVLHKLASKPGLAAKIFKAIADPPTTSLQRLKGLTTGGLPTFIDVGNSFGAPAIIEDNLIYQLAQNGKRVVMMGDDTWVQLFPHHFHTSYPFPSFNVKDLHTVDNGCIEHLVPSLYKQDWDVLIAHFLGDHAGHILGVDSSLMTEKLEQYNGVLENVVEVLESMSGPGGLHENTMLLVMGDHGQTINGDHGGGSAEEVETALFALSLKNSSSSLPCEFESSSCQLEKEKKRISISSIYQLDFAATVSALLGLPFPFGSIGRVDPELYGLAAGTGEPRILGLNDRSDSGFEEWMKSYVNVLCINSWQVKRYMDVYSASSTIGFSQKDLLHVSELYTRAQEMWSQNIKSSLLCNTKSCNTLSSAIMNQIDAYSDFLATVAGLARSKWTEFNIRIMSIGLCLMVASLFTHVYAIKRLDNLFGLYFTHHGNSGISFMAVFAYTIVLIRASSFLSNSYILEEGKVASFLLATTGILQLQYAIVKKKMVLEGLAFILLVPMLKLGIELGQAKQAVNSLFLKFQPSWTLGIVRDSQVLMHVVEIVPLLGLILLACMLYKCILCGALKGILKYVVSGTIFNYVLIALIWASDSDLLSLPMVLEAFKGNLIPRIVYASSLLQLLSLAIFQILSRETGSGQEESTVYKALAMLSSWSSTVILLSGKQGPLVALSSVIAGWCIIKLTRFKQDSDSCCTEDSSFYSFPVVQWSLLATSLFFCTGHWCAFDGLRYAAAFIGFDEFNLIRQAVLLALDTFGFSHILPILGLPLLVALLHSRRKAKQGNNLFPIQLCQVYLMYGLIMAVSVTFTILCVTIQRRHLMVWGLFAPKFVFDVVGLILSDFFICLASLYYLV
ncbi:GPI ethanolamine phosphate transferase 3-like isoform X2 [Coffea eugenioides]|uniref:GPI ethanolamine phosphate transferase 3-like isoform X2 n=1 Tax=Coffea eugenioides TaxID=49369 RepID=UPI000F6107C3|nr:GPI ethanolamine phosphate transferase 3-like isoform X2 [Coffea eugenioides]